MKKTGLIFIIVFIFQLAVPLWMIIEKEGILQQGQLVKFQIEPVDPYDAFRGKYLSIGIIENSVYTNTNDFLNDQTIYALIEIDTEGFAYFDEISLTLPENRLYIKCRIDYIKDNYITLVLPFDRYYINEEYSQMGEDLYNKYSRGNREDAYITVRIKKGKAVLENMYLSGIEINQFIKDEINLD